MKHMWLQLNMFISTARSSFPPFLPVAVAVELSPTVLATFYIWKYEEKIGGERSFEKVIGT